MASNMWDIPPDWSIETNENGWWVRFDKKEKEDLQEDTGVYEEDIVEVE